MIYNYSLDPIQTLSLRNGHTAYDLKIGTIESWEIAYGNELFVANEVVEGKHFKGDTWLKVSAIGDRLVDGWVAVIHLGKTYGYLNTAPSSEFPKFAKLKHRFQVDGQSILEHNGFPLYPLRPDGQVGVPSVIRSVTPTQADYCLFTREWQRYSFFLLKKLVKKQKPLLTEFEVIALAKKIFASGYRGNAFQSNKRGTFDPKTGKPQRHDWINGTGEDLQDIGLQPIFTGGNVVQVIGDKVKKAGLYYYPVKCFNGSIPPPSPADVNWENHPELVLWGTIETRIQINGDQREIRPFGFSGITGFPYFVIVENSDVCYIEDNRISFITDEQAMNNNPYITP